MPDSSLTWIDRFEPEQAHQIVELFDREWWTTGRTLEGVNRMLEGSTELVGVLDGERLVAFGRSISDGVYRASLNDIIVVEERRGEGLGVAVIKELLSRPSVAESNHVDLHCREEMVPFYESLGFRRSNPEIHRMEIGEHIG